MAVTDRDPVDLTADDLERIAADRHIEDAAVGAKPGRARESAESSSLPLSSTARVLLATLSAATGAIHLVMVPGHAGEWLAEGLAFAAAGWLQIGLALLILVRPSRAALRVSCLANAGFIVAWVITRVGGMPFGPNQGHVELASFVDITNVSLEALLILVGYELLVRPDRGARLNPSARYAFSAAPLAILALTTAALVSPSASNHAHNTGGGDVAGAAHDHGSMPSAAAPSGAAGSAGTGDHGHGAGSPEATPVDDKGLSKVMNGQGEGGGHTHAATNVALDAATQAQLDAQLAETKLLVAKYPTVKDAEAAGYSRSGPFAPALGAHYTGRITTAPNVDGVMDSADIAAPTLIYDGVEPDSKLAGFMYNVFSLDTEKGPEGFVGPNDHWHYHTNVCLVRRPGGGLDAPLGADTTATKELCDKYGGFLIANTGYMVHVWTVPGYESPDGVFSNLNANITCPNGTYHMVEPEEIGSRSNACKDVPAPS